MDSILKYTEYFVKPITLQKPTELEEVFKIILSKTPDYYIEFVVQIILVTYGARKAFLFESSNFTGEGRQPVNDLKFVISVVNRYGGDLKLTMQDGTHVLKRYFVTKKSVPVKTKSSDEEIAALLGFYCKGHDYSNQNKQRISASISLDSKHDIYAEICETQKIDLKKFEFHVKNKTNNFNLILKKFGMHATVKFDNMIPETILLKNLKAGDLDYVKKNMDKYIDILENNYRSKDYESGKISFDAYKDFVKTTKIYKNLINVNKDNVNKVYSVLQALLDWDDEDSGKIENKYFI
jgi:hypothetical protein